MTSKPLRWNLLPLFCLIVLCAASPDTKKGPPDWLEKTIIPGTDYIYAVGRSGSEATEQKARDAALADATGAFVKYCKVDVAAFDRSVEVYSSADGKISEKTDISSQNLVRAKAFVKRAVPTGWYVEKSGVFAKSFVAHVLLQVPKEEFDRITSEKNVKFSLDFQLFYEGADGALQPLKEGDVLKSGDGYALYAKPSDSSYLYIYQTDAEGKSYRLFPNANFGTGANPLAPAAGAWFPNERKLYTLDETTGKERLYLFASPDKIFEFEGDQAVALTQTDLDNAVSLKKMGVAKVRAKRDPLQVPVTARKLDVRDLKNKLVADGAFVYETWFWHK